MQIKLVVVVVAFSSVRNSNINFFVEILAKYYRPNLTLIVNNSGHLSDFDV